jgi:hypothetical protein
MDAKATVAVGPFSRKGKSRVETHASDHDFKPKVTITPVGILIPTTAELFVYAVASKATSDCLVDFLSQCWATIRDRFPTVTTLILNLDNGPENHSRRTQFMARIVDFVRESGVTVQLAYYPPYHSKYNPIERCWGALEQHWNGSLLDSVDAVLNFIKTMTWKGVQPLVELVTTTYHTGVKLSKDDMEDIEMQIVRLPDLGKWFITISPTTIWAT